MTPKTEPLERQQIMLQYSYYNILTGRNVMWYGAEWTWMRDTLVGFVQPKMYILSRPHYLLLIKYNQTNNWGKSWAENPQEMRSTDKGGFCPSCSMSSVWISVVLNTQIYQRERSTGMQGANLVPEKIGQNNCSVQNFHLYRVFIYHNNLYQIRYSKSILIKMLQLILSLSQRFMR